MLEIFVEFVESQPWKHQNRSRIKLSEPLDEEVVKTKYDRYTLKIEAGKFLSQFNCDLPAVFAVEFVLKFLRFCSRQYAKILQLPAHFQRNISQQMAPFCSSVVKHSFDYDLEGNHGPATRQAFDAVVSDADQRNYYWPPFEAAVSKARAGG
jgi:hypothetical protein